MVFQNKLNQSLKNNSDKIAIECMNKKVSYSEVLYNSDLVAKLLQKRGIDEQTIIGIQLTDKFDLIYSIIGILNTRCIFVPLDKSLPEKRILSLIEEMNLRYVITSYNDSTHLNTYKGLGIHIIYIEDILDVSSNMYSEPINYPTFVENDSIYIYFTSGSTGRPKGVVGRNSSLIRFINWEINAFEINGSHRFSQFTSPYFDAFLRDVFVPLLSGGIICLPPQIDNFYTRDNLVSWIDKERINIIHCVPSLFQLINNELISPQNFKDINYILLSGERIIPGSLKNWFKIFDTRIQLVNLYGPTETTMIRTFYKIKPEDASKTRIPIGYPIDNTEILILNKDFIRCEKLVPGDLYIITNDASNGYLNNPELSAIKFSKKKDIHGNKLTYYKTGDKAKMLGDGTLDLLGREDRQVKLRGIRIELDEIEHYILDSGLVKNCIVMVTRVENSLEESLVAFVIGNSHKKEQKNFDKEIQNYVADYIPYYMVPSIIKELSEFPLLVNGKIDHKVLLKTLTNKIILEPSNEIERNLLKLWREVLGDRPISIDEDFGRAGGSSLGIMQLIGLIYREFNIRITLQELFDNQTIQQQTKLIEHSIKDGSLTIKRTEKKASYPLSASQERMYYEHMLNPNGILFNLPIAWEIKGVYDKIKIEQVLRSLIKRHESFRTEIRVANGMMLQVVKEDVDFTLEEIKEQDRRISDIMNDFIKPFDLEKAPLMRASIILRKGKNNLLLFDTHHVICDGVSQHILYYDFLRLYNGELLEPLEIHYRDYAAWENEFKKTKEYISHREFWLKGFEGNIPELDLPSLYKEKERLSDAGGEIVFSIDNRIFEEILISAERDTTLFSVLFSMYFIYLVQISGNEEIVVGIANSGRIQQEIQNVVGMFVKTLPIQFKINPKNSFRETLNELHSTLVKANSNQIYDLIDILRELNVNKSVPVSDLFQTVFVFHNYGDNQVYDNNKDFSLFDFKQTSAKYPISMSASQGSGAVDFRLEYLTTYFSERDAKMLAEQFMMLVTKLSESLDTELMQIITDVGQPKIIEDDITFNF